MKEWQQFARGAARGILFVYCLPFFVAGVLVRAAVEWSLAGWDAGARVMSGDA